MTSSLAYSVTLVAVFAAAFLAMQLVIGAGRQAARRAGFANYRLKMLDSDDPQTVVLARMRRARGLDDHGQLGEAMRWIGKLILHSGLRRVKVWMVPVAMVATSLALVGAVWAWRANPTFALVGGAAGAALPVLALMWLGKRRRAKTISQLPDALDVIVRSLGAGHPVPVAMKLVGREMPDPIGSEFGMASDEVGFGAGVAAAIQRMAERVDHDDMYLFAAMIRLQERTGGNLADLLRSSSKTIRDRQAMRLRIRAASAEGRISALILNVAPILVLLGVNLMSPDFYGEVEGHPWIRLAFWGVAGWMVLGNLIMRRMINFRI